MQLPVQLTPRHEITAHIAQGGIAVVYEGRVHNLGVSRPVAIKVPLRGQEAALTQEGVLGSSLSHPNIRSVLDLVESERGTRFLVLEYVPGWSLEEVIDLCRMCQVQIPHGVVVMILRQICDGLSYLHQRGTVHGDMKPGNVLLGIDGAIKLIDIGILPMVEPLPDEDDLLFCIGHGQTPRTPRCIAGSPPYLAPEQAADMPSGPTASSDLYSMGLLLYELVLQTRVNKGESLLETLNRAARGPTAAQRETLLRASPLFGSIFASVTQLRPEDRTQSAQDLGRQLESIHIVPGLMSEFVGQLQLFSR